MQLTCGGAIRRDRNGMSALLIKPTAKNGEILSLSQESAGWQTISLRVLRLEHGQTHRLSQPDEELVLVMLGGKADIRAGSRQWQSLGGRADVFSGMPHSLYLPLGTGGVEIQAQGTCEVAVCGARATQKFPAAVIEPSSVEVEIRGGGNATRQINHILKPNFPADRILIVEVYTPSGNWSSYPPHKHDIHDMPREADLEEIYYYRIAPPDGFGLQRLYTADGTTDAAYVIHDGDLLLVPEGYHAFAVAQGYTGYYLNVLAGDEPVRTMQPSDDPAYAWVRGSWSDELNAGLRSWRDIEDRVNGPAGRLPG